MLGEGAVGDLLPAARQPAKVVSQVTMFSSRCSPGVQEVARDMRRSWHELVCESGAPLRLIFDSLKLVLDLDVINFIADGE